MKDPLWNYQYKKRNIVVSPERWSINCNSKLLDSYLPRDRTKGGSAVAALVWIGSRQRALESTQQRSAMNALAYTVIKHADCSDLILYCPINTKFLHDSLSTFLFSWKKRKLSFNEGLALQPHSLCFSTFSGIFVYISLVFHLLC